jgi:hypothetical protein
MNMSKESRDYLEMAYHSIQCFSNDGRLLLPELEQILAIALKDGTVDANEKRVLASIFGRLTPSELTPAMQQRIAQIRSQHSF